METRLRPHLSQKVVVQLVAGDHIQVTGGVNGGRECRGVRPSGSDQGAHSIDLTLHEHSSECNTQSEITQALLESHRQMQWYVQHVLTLESIKY